MFYLPAGSAIVKNCKNLVNAQRFIDFIISPEIQDAYGTTVTNRPVMAGVATPSYMTPIAEINVIEENMKYVSDNKQTLREKFKDIYVDIQG